MAPSTVNSLWNPSRSVASVRIWLMEATSPRSSSTEGRRPRGDGAELGDRVLHRGAHRRQHPPVAEVSGAGSVRRPFEGVDLPADVDQRLEWAVVQLLGDMASFLLLAQHHLTGIGLHQVVPSRLGRHVLEDHLHPPVGPGCSHEGRGRPVEDTPPSTSKVSGRDRVLDVARRHADGPRPGRADRVGPRAGLDSPAVVEQAGEHHGGRIRTDHVDEPPPVRPGRPGRPGGAGRGSGGGPMANTSAAAAFAPTTRPSPSTTRIGERLDSNMS